MLLTTSFKVLFFIVLAASQMFTAHGDSQDPAKPQQAALADTEERRANAHTDDSLMDVDDYRPSFSFEAEVVRIEYTDREQPPYHPFTAIPMVWVNDNSNRARTRDPSFLILSAPFPSSTALRLHCALRSSKTHHMWTYISAPFPPIHATIPFSI
ncbi:hypothetical protein FISHEDRAFT_69747 [Fistulina hepatica ATCC 64428]|uniref:Uncharacterized protein n=1 Tax=Fistulina hepatica ATCC 64428 TaxID=1128425 RepID=A0A0D7ALT1_9AGAR|nr:hypothetical protein FISHEDRAFT_69747 [Fistulina hepatica ATCC 64428]